MDAYKAEFEESGFVVMRGCYSSTFVYSLRPPPMTDESAAGLLADPDVAKRVSFGHPVGNAATADADPASAGVRVPNKLEQCSALAEPFRALWDGLACDRSLRKTAEALLGGPVVILKDKYVFKQRGGPGFTPHQDLTYAWHRFASRAITAHIAFDAADPENSALQVARGCHTSGLVLSEAGPERELPDDFVERLPFEFVRLAPGDVLWFDGLVPHKSEPNSSVRNRGVYYVSFAAVSDVVPRFRGSAAAAAAASTPDAEDAAAVPAGAAQAAVEPVDAGDLTAYAAYYEYYWQWTGEEGAFAADWAGPDGTLTSATPVATTEQRDAMVDKAWDLFEAKGNHADLVPGCLRPSRD